MVKEEIPTGKANTIIGRKVYSYIRKARKQVCQGTVYFNIVSKLQKL